MTRKDTIAVTSGIGAAAGIALVVHLRSRAKIKTLKRKQKELEKSYKKLSQDMTSLQDEVRPIRDQWRRTSKFLEKSLEELAQSGEKLKTLVELVRAAKMANDIHKRREGEKVAADVEVVSEEITDETLDQSDTN